MWVPAPFTEWAHHEAHPFYRAGHPKAGNGIAFFVDGWEVPVHDVVAASVTNGYVKRLVRNAAGVIITEPYRGGVRPKTINSKGPVNIMVRKDLTNA